MLCARILLFATIITHLHANLTFEGLEKPHKILVNAAVEIANSNFNLRAATVVFYNDVEESLINNFVNSYRGTVVIDARRNSVPPPKQVVVLVNSFMSFLKILGKLKPDLHGKAVLNGGVKCLIVLLSYPHRLQRINKILWNFHTVDVVTLLGDRKGKVSIYTYYPYSSPGNCSNTEPFFIGFWQDNTTATSQMFPDKMINMNGCPMYISTNKLYHPSTEKRIPLQIVKKSIVTLLKEVMNFSPIIYTTDYVSVDSDRSKNWSDSLSDIIIGTANISTCNIPLGIERLGLLDYTIPYFRVRLAWLAPPITPAASWWRLFCPLNGYLSLVLLIVTCSVKSLPILLKMSPINKFSFKYFKNIQNLNAVALRVWGIMCGQSVKVLPKRFRDFYIVSLWIWFTFVIRSVYQSVLIGALKTDTFIGGYLNLKEASEDGFEFGGRAGILAHFEHDPMIRSKFRVVSEVEFEKTFSAIIGGRERFVMATSLEYAWAFCVSKGVKENECGHVLPDSIMTLPLVVWMRMYSPLTQPLSEWIPRFIETGLLERDIRVSVYPINISNDPSALTEKQIISCLLCLTIGYAVSLSVFLFRNI